MVGTQRDLKLPYLPGHSWCNTVLRSWKKKRPLCDWGWFRTPFPQVPFEAFEGFEGFEAPFEGVPPRGGGGRRVEGSKPSKGASRASQAFEGASKGFEALEGGFKGFKALKGAWRGLEGGLQGLRRAGVLQGLGQVFVEGFLRLHPRLLLCFSL